MPWPPLVVLPNRDPAGPAISVVRAGERLPGASKPLPVDGFVCDWSGKRSKSADAELIKHDLMRMDGEHVGTEQFVHRYGLASGAVYDWSVVGLMAGGTVWSIQFPESSWSDLIGEFEHFQAEPSDLSDPDVLLHFETSRRWQLIRPLYGSRELKSLKSDPMERFKGRNLTDQSLEFIPLDLATFDLLQLRVDLLCAMRTGDDDRRVAQAVLQTAHLMYDPVGFPFEQLSADEAVLGLFGGHVHAASDSTFRQLQPRLAAEPVRYPWWWSVADYLFVDLFNDLNANFPAKVCANPECGELFTRQRGQAGSSPRQSRRDARACSKSCADRIVYLNRRNRR